MRLAVFSDIHANQEALEAFIRDASRRMVHRYICLGDIVGYGASPNECIRLIRSLPKINFVLGNHDAALARSDLTHYMSEEAHNVVLWTKQVLLTENVEFLKRIKATISMGGISFSHSTPYDPFGWHYAITREYAEHSFSHTKERIMFVGHVHIPLIITRKNIFRMNFDQIEGNSVFSLGHGNRHIIICGSIGQPRDGNPAASYLIYDTLKEQIEFYRVEYDHRLAAEKIMGAGLPESLAVRLHEGR